MNYLVLVASLACLVFAGCLVGPTGAPSPHPQPTFEYEYTQSDGATVLSIRTVDDGGLAHQPIRIYVGEALAYENGTFHDPYAESANDENEWADGVDTGDTIRITSGTALEPGTEVRVAVLPADSAEFVTVSENVTPATSDPA